MPSLVSSVSRSAAHGIGKQPTEVIRLVEGHGVEGDAHAGAAMQHRSRAARNPTLPNLRQVHLIEAELFADLAADHQVVHPGDLGENISTTGLDLRILPTDAVLHIGEEAQVRLTGLRTPCRQIDDFSAGLRKQVTTTDASGKPSFRSGVMAVVTRSGLVRPGDAITVILPRARHVSLTGV